MARSRSNSSRSRKRRGRLRDRRRRSDSHSSRGRSRSKRSSSHRRSAALGGNAAPAASALEPRTVRDFMDKYATEVPADVRSAVGQKLQEAGYQYEWQVTVMPREVLLTVLPPSSMGLNLTAVLHAQRVFGLHATSGGSEVTAKLGQVIKHQQAHTHEARRLRRSKRNNVDNQDESSSDTTGAESLDASGCLTKYGLASIDQCHFVSLSSMRPLVRGAKKAKKKGKGVHIDFIIDRDVSKCAPQWMRDKDRPAKGESIHAHWVAAWWARAFDQMTIQAAVGQETVPFDKLLNHFLNCNRIAIEDSVRIAQVYEADLWAELAEATKRKDKQCNPSQRLMMVDENSRTRARRVAIESAQAGRKWGGKCADKGCGKGVAKNGVSPNFQGQPKGAHKGNGDQYAGSSWHGSSNWDTDSGPMRKSVPWIKERK